jgi:hypothetical protein
MAITSVGHSLTDVEVQELLGNQNERAVFDYFSGGKYSKALNGIVKIREERVALAAKMVALAEERAALAEESAALKDKIAFFEEKAAFFDQKAAFFEEKTAFAKEKAAFAKEKEKARVIKLYNEEMELDSISYYTGLNIEEINKIISNM